MTKQEQLNKLIKILIKTISDCCDRKIPAGKILDQVEEDIEKLQQSRYKPASVKVAKAKAKEPS